MPSFFDESVSLELSKEGAMQVLAFLEAHRDGSPMSSQLINARDCAIYALENQLYSDTLLADFLTSKGLVAA
jgi:hypothetical protein